MDARRAISDPTGAATIMMAAQSKQNINTSLMLGGAMDPGNDLSRGPTPSSSVMYRK